MTVNPTLSALVALVASIAVIVLALFVDGLLGWLKGVLLVAGVVVAAGATGVVVKTVSAHD